MTHKTYIAKDRRIDQWRRCVVLVMTTRQRLSMPEKGLVSAFRFSARPANCLVLFAGDVEPVVRPWRGIRVAR